MVQIVENHAEISGTIIGSAPDPELPGFVVLAIRVDGAHDVEGSPNLFCHDIGQTIHVHARSDSAAATGEGNSVRLRVKKVGPGRSFAEE